MEHKKPAMLQLEQLANMSGNQACGAFLTTVSIALLIPLFTQLNIIPFVGPFAFIMFIYFIIIYNFDIPIVETFALISFGTFLFSFITLFTLLTFGPITQLFVMTSITIFLMSASSLVMLIRSIMYSR